MAYGFRDPEPAKIGIDAHPHGFDPAVPLRWLPPERGALVARVLEGSWRAEPPPLQIAADEIARVAPLLIHSGAAALGWHRIRATVTAGEPQAQELHATARRLVFGDVLRADSLRQIAAILNAAGIVPMVFKGWAATHYYAEPHLRPYGDFDLLVPAEQFQTALATLHAHAVRPVTGTSIPVDCMPRDRSHWVDLHATLNPRYGVALDRLFSEAACTSLGKGAAVLVPRHEDHLRIVTLHFFKHGGCRPLWLCDVAAMAEAAGTGFDWDRCLGHEPAGRSWMMAGIGAARRLLGARVDHLPGEAWREAPGWLIEILLREWRAPYARRVNPARGAALSNPKAWLGAHWPNPALATFLRGRPVSSRAKGAHQIANFLTNHVRPSMANALDPRWWSAR